MHEPTTAAAKGSTSKTRKDYRNAGLSSDRRVDDLLGRMTLAERAGMLFQTMIMVGSGDLAERSSAFGVESAEHMINNQLLSHFNIVQASRYAGLLREKFVLGLFDNPYVDIDHAAATVGKAEFVAAGADAQRQSVHTADQP